MGTVVRSATIAQRGVLLIGLLLGTSCSSPDSRNITETTPQGHSSGPKSVQRAPAQRVGNPEHGKEVFRFATFGNEGFWHDVMQWQQGVVDSQMTPKQMLEIGLQFDTEAMEPSLRKTLAGEFHTDLSRSNAPSLNDPHITVALLNANAVIGVAVKDSNGDKTINIMQGDKIGVTCALCHTVTDKSAYNLAGKGSAGKRIDGRAALDFNMGEFLALAKNSKAYYLNLQQNHLGVLSIGRATRGLGPSSTEEEVDAYLRNPEFYPVGTFDETPDGIGNPVKNTPLFRQDLAAPYGSGGEFEKFEDITNGSYTMNLDMTGVATPQGREFLQKRGGMVGLEIFNEYQKILSQAGVTSYPFADSKVVSEGGVPHTPVGRLVDIGQVRDLTAYVFALPAPRGAQVNAQAAARGRAIFTKQCTSCHNADQSKPVPNTLVDLKTLWPGYTGLPVGLRGDKAQSTILNSLGTYDDKMVIADASWRGEPRLPRGHALPLLLDLDNTTLFLHDASVKSLDELLHPRRGHSSPHPFYISDAEERSNLIDFLRSLDAQPEQISRQ